MTAEQVSALAGGLLSLVLAYLPFVSKWYDALDPKLKATVMGIVLVIVSAALWGWGCRADAEIVACLQKSAPEFVSVLWAALTANLGVYFVAVRQFKK